MNNPKVSKVSKSSGTVKKSTKPIPPTVLNKILRKDKSKYLSLSSQFILKYGNCFYENNLYYFIDNKHFTVDVVSNNIVCKNLLYTGDIYSLCYIEKSKITIKFCNQFLKTRCREITILYPPNKEALTIKGFLFGNSTESTERSDTL